MQLSVKLCSLVCLAALVLAANTADAQRRGRGGFGTNVLSVAAVEEVGAELKFSEEHTAAVKKLNDEYRQQAQEAFQNTGDLSREERGERFRKLGEQRREKEKKLGEALGEEKMKRVRQLSLQASGIVSALMSRDTSEKLAISEDQRNQAFQKMRDMRDQFEDAGDDADAIAKLRAKMAEQITEILTDDQKKNWKEMLGEPASEELLAKIREATSFGRRRRNA